MYLETEETGGFFSQKKSDTASRSTLSGRNYSMIFYVLVKKGKFWYLFFIYLLTNYFSRESYWYWKVEVFATSKC